MDEITIDVVLDTVDVTVNIQGPDTIHTHLSVDVTDLQANVSLNTDVAASKEKTDFITITQDVDLDQLEADVAANNAKVGVTNEEANPDVVSQAEAEAGTATAERIWTAERVAQAIAALGGGGGGGGSLEQEINQVAHGLSAGEAIRHNGTVWVKSQGDVLANSGTVGVVKEVTDVDNFIYSSGGLMTTGSWTNGVSYFLSTTVAGAIIAEPIYSVGQVREFIGTGTPEGLEINIDLGKTVTELTGNGYLENFTSLSTVNVNHALNTLTPIVEIYDNTNVRIQPSKITVVDADNITIDFGSAKTGRLVVGGGVKVAIGGGIETVEQAFAEAIKTDKQYFSVNTNRHTQVDQIDFTANLTGAIINGGGVSEVVVDSDYLITFTSDFNAVSSELPIVDNAFYGVDGETYRFTFFYTGAKIDVNISEIEDVNVVTQLTAPTISSATPSGLTVALSITDNNTSPNEASTQIEYKANASSTWLVHGQMAQDGTSYDVTGLTASTLYDFRVKAIGTVGGSLNSVYSATSQATTGPSILLDSDNFDNNSIDLGIWTETTDASGSTDEQNQQLEMSSTGSGSFFGLIGGGYSSSNDLIVVQVKVGKSANVAEPNFLFGLSTSPYTDSERVQIVRTATGSAYDKYTCIIKDGGTNEVSQDTGITNGKDVRIKYVPSTGAVTFEYWNVSTWTEFSSTAGNVDLGATVVPFLYAKAGNSSGANYAYFDDFYISEDDYSTQYPS